MLFLITRKSIAFNKYAYVARITLLVLVIILPGCESNTELPIAPNESVQMPSPDAVNINTASAAELERIPHIGEKLAQQIVDYRERYGAFRKAEHLMLIPGISDSRFRKIRDLIRVD